MHHALTRSPVLVAAVCALLCGCSSVAPDWAWPGERAQAAPATIAVIRPVATSSLDDACHAEAWQHRLDILGDERLSYGQAYRRCMDRQVAGTRPEVAAPREPAVPAQLQRAPRPSRN